MDEITAQQAERIARAVIWQALHDAGFASRRRDRLAVSRTTQEYRDAFLFLTARSGPWAESRRLFCDLADLSEEKLVALAATVPEPLAPEPSRLCRKTPTHRLAIEMRDALAKRGIDFMTCPAKQVLFLALEMGFKSPTGRPITKDTIWHARNTLNNAASNCGRSASIRDS